MKGPPDSKGNMAVRLAFFTWMVALMFIPCAWGEAESPSGRVKLSMGQYRVVAADNSYWYTPLSAYYSVSGYKAKITLPLVSLDNGPSGVGNGVLKLSKLNQWQGLYVDVHLKKKLNNANENVTLAVADTSLSLEVSGFVLGGLGFVELGHWWRDKVGQSQRENSFYYSLGGVMSLKKIGFSKGWIGGVVVDHKPTSLGDLDRVGSVLLQRKLSARHKITGSIGKGISHNSPDWISGLMWQVKL